MKQYFIFCFSVLLVGISFATFAYAYDPYVIDILTDETLIYNYKISTGYGDYTVNDYEFLSDSCLSLKDSNIIICGNFTIQPNI